VRRAFALIAVLASLWAATVWLLGGFALSIGPLRVSSSDSVRPLSVALVATVIYVALAGSAAVREDARRLLRALTPRRLALLLTALIVVIGISNDSWAVGGSDSYSYASRMDLWLRGSLSVPIRIANGPSDTPPSQTRPQSHRSLHRDFRC
jgi:hypothetical protein